MAAWAIVGTRQGCDGLGVVVVVVPNSAGSTEREAERGTGHTQQLKAYSCSQALSQLHGKREPQGRTGDRTAIDSVLNVDVVHNWVCPKPWDSSKGCSQATSPWQHDCLEGGWAERPLVSWACLAFHLWEFAAQPLSGKWSAGNAI